MQCEVCGRQIVGKPHKVIIERAKMLTCAECAELGSPYYEPEPRSLEYPAKGAIGPALKTATVKRKDSPHVSEDLGITEGFGSLVRQAREKLGLSQEDLGRKIGEKVSVIAKIEGEKMVPDEKLAGKLEHALRVKLLVRLLEQKAPFPSPPPDKGVTLGEIVVLKDQREKEAPKGREQS